MLGQSPIRMSERTFLQFQVGPSAFGLPVSRVVEIIRVVAFAPVPSASPNLLGMVNVRGRVIPVFDLCRALGLGERPLTLRMYIVITEAAGEAFGVLVDDVNDVVTFDDDSFQASRALAGAGSYAAATARKGDLLLTILDLAPLVTPDEARATDAL
jgi:purine-binding chemotaxis protein CheW